MNHLQVVPFTTNVDRIYPGEALVNLKGKYNKAMADQLTTVSKLRLLERLGKLSNVDMGRVEHAVMVQLGLTIRHI